MLLHGPNLWPTNPSTFKPTMEDWVEKMNLLGLALLEATAMGLGVDMEGEEWVQLKSKVLESFWSASVLLDCFIDERYLTPILPSGLCVLSLIHHFPKTPKESVVELTQIMGTSLSVRNPVSSDPLV